MAQRFDEDLGNAFCSAGFQVPGGWNVLGCYGAVDISNDRIQANPAIQYTCELNGQSETSGDYCYIATQRSTPPAMCASPAIWHVNNWKRGRGVECPFGTVSSGDGNCYLQSLVPDKQVCRPSVGYPVDPLTGNKFLVENDFADGSQRGSLTLTRTYNSLLSTKNGGYPAWRIGKGWRHTFDRSAQVLGGATLTMAYARRQDGRMLIFTYDSNTGQYVGDPDNPAMFRDAAPGSDAIYEFVDADDTVEAYDADGKLLRITTREGFVTTLAYDVYDRLSSVTDISGRSLIFNYSDGNDVAASSVTLPDGTSINYSYVDGTLTHVGYADGSSKDYQYTSGPSNLQGAFLTDVYHSGVHYTHYEYGEGSEFGTVNTQVVSETLVGPQSTFSSFHYVKSGNLVTTTFTTPLGASMTYKALIQFNKAKLKSVSSPCVGCGGGTVASTEYDPASGYPTSRTDFNGNITTYAYDNVRGLELSRTEASNDASPQSVKRTIETDWHANYRVPVQRRTMNAASVVEAKTKWSYNARGQATNRCDIDINVLGADAYTCGSSMNAPAGVRQWVYTYCEQAGVTDGTCPIVGLLNSTNGPRSTGDAGMNGFDDATTYTYYQTDDASCASNGACTHRHGDLWKVTNALGQVTETISYDKNGRPTRTKDANGTYTDYVYQPRGWLTDRIVRASANGNPGAGDATTHIDYDAVGDVTKVTQPDGDYLSYSYDDAHRLIKIIDPLGNWIDYCPGGVGSAECLDAAGNRRVEETWTQGPGPAQIKRSLHRVYDALGHLQQVKNAATQPIFDATSGYDGNGNLALSKDGRNFSTQQSYDGLNRLIQTLQNVNGVDPATKNTKTDYVYDARDNLRTVTDPDLLPTNYTYDALNNLTDLSSPDTGHTGYGYDKAGNRTGQTDNRGTTSTYTYDALNRLITITYPTASLNVTYAYDQINAVTGCTTSYPAGRLTKMTDGSGSTTYCYDRHGNVTQKKQITSAATLITLYAYTAGDRLTSLTYPSGLKITYTRDAVGRISAVTELIGATATTLVSSATYYPFGPLNVLTFGTGRTLTKTYDEDYAIDQITSSVVGGLALDFVVDVMGDITNASALTGPPTSRTFVYDPLYRLTTVQSGVSHFEDYTYNKTGDRLSVALNGGPATTYAYTPNTHHLASVGASARTYDANGNTQTGAGPLTLSYDDKNRLATAGNYTYQTNGRGERVRKAASGAQGLPRVYGYDESGQLLGEYGPSGAVQAEYVYLDNLPIAVVKAGVVAYVETDHLGTPRQVIDPATNNVLWKWDFFGSAFGTNAPTGAYVLNLRFPGQYFDSEMGLNYNYFRDYEATTGRYVESDPVGLKGGPSTYGYASSAPLQKLDPYGLYNYYPSDPSMNTTICDGEGNIMPQIQNPLDWWNRRCIGDCMLAHELSHVDDLRALGTSGCKGRPKGTIVTFDTKSKLNKSERHAYREEAKCLEEKLKRGLQCDECTPTIQDRMKQINDARKRFE